MADIQNIDLKIQNGRTTDKKLVTVSFTAFFLPEEVRDKKKFKYSITLYGKDYYGDEQPFRIPPQMLYKFNFNIFYSPNFAVLTADDLKMEITKSNEVSAEVLNEDPGWHYERHSNLVFTVFDPDEIYAVVSLVQDFAQENYIKLETQPRPTAGRI